MRSLILLLACLGSASASPVDEFIAAAADRHGEFGEQAARFLVEHMPGEDKRSLTAEFLIENLDLAMEARKKYAWAADVPREIFFNNVLPYAVFDEPRDPWRADFLEKADGIVGEAESAREAAQLLNRDFFDLIATHYDTGRKRTNQSPRESIEQGKATCTGLSIILVDACRAVGIPARAVGTPLWQDKSGNHTWVEVWDDGWHFTGADEHDEKGLNRAWFTAKAAQAPENQPRHGIYATSWDREQGHFPMVWSPGSRQVGAVDVTARYRSGIASDEPDIGVRFFEDGERVIRAGALATAAGTVVERFETKAAPADMNDMPRLEVNPGESYRLRFEIADRLYETAVFEALEADRTIHDVTRDELSEVPDFTDEEAALSEQEAARAVRYFYEIAVNRQRQARSAELEAKSISHGDHEMRWLEETYGEAADGQRSLWISMHGGGGAPARVNDRQWRNQVRLYQPEEGIYVAPRAPTNTWNLWHQQHIDPLFARLIENMVALRGVDPDRVYLMGYSAGGDGVWQLAPRMADRFAAAAMMAGHPNEASLLGLRNLPFAVFMGGNDSAYDRNKVAAEKTAELVRLREADPQGYRHLSRIYPGVGHWMNKKDAEALPWMAQFERDPWPARIVWFQDDVVHDRCYWLRLPDGTAEKGQKITAEVEGQEIRVQGDVPSGTRILLSDELLDLDQQVVVRVREAEAFEVKPVRNPGTIRTALEQRLDPVATPVAEIVIP